MMPATFSEKNTNRTKCLLLPTNKSDRNQFNLLAICINCHLLRCNDCIYFCTILVKHKATIVSKLNRIYLLIVTLICLNTITCRSQNLVANGSFENYHNISCLYGSFDNYTIASIPHIVDDWYALNSPDYYNSICNTTTYGIPTNSFGSAYAKEGNAYPAFLCYGSSYETKEYVFQHLSAPLQAGHIYCLNFYATRADNFTHAIHSLGAYFSVATPTLYSNYYVNATPQVLNQTGYITDTTQWVQIQGCFMAIGGENYITLGNFNSNANTDTLYVGANDLTYAAYNYAYYYIDDVTLIDQATVGLQNINTDNVIDIYPNPNTGLLKFSNLKYVNKDYNVRILDIFGKEILNEVLKEELDISFLDKGVYTLLLYKNKQLVVTKKVMKD